MAHGPKKSTLISHKPVPRSAAAVVAELQERIIEQGDNPHVSAAEQLSLLEQLTTFELGKFLLVNLGLNGYWTHYAAFLHPQRRRADPQASAMLCDLEKFLLNEAPTMLATQERFTHFQRVVQHEIDSRAGEEMAIASVPCGVMADLLTLKYPLGSAIHLAGLDLDDKSLSLASEFAAQNGLPVQLSQEDAWELSARGRFDVLLSNGLNIYEPSDDRVTSLYAVFGSAMKPGGLLVTSFLTTPAEWEARHIDSAALAHQRVIFSDILGVGWQCFRSSDLSRRELTQAGFHRIEVIPDRSNLFPTVVARWGGRP